MNKSDLVSAMAKKNGMTEKATKAVLDSFMEVVSETLANGESISLVGFGTFEIRERAARKGVNPRTKEEILIEASTVPAFKPGQALKNAVNK